MTVKELIKKLKEFPEDLEVVEMDKFEGMYDSDNNIYPILSDEPFLKNGEMVCEQCVVL